ncbi:MAG: penicillin-binding protein 1C [Deltaproteobacteria bacterium HGW-Deltaproteobacteria-6]|nr:MAG: penicillin-binding protein 1C [Deltaproteobacteria bacterium HGW-Deltaproteobacteria-6]
MMNNLFKYLFAVLALGILPADNAYALPSFEEVRTAHVKSDSLLLDRHGELLYELRTDKQGRRLDWTKLDDISPSLKEAVIFSEDKRFYSHAGVDYQAFGAAALGFLSGSGLRGASTITMQLASFLNKNTAIKTKQRTLQQKTTQILMAREIEKRWSKKEILEAYLNLVTFRGEYTGIAAASQGLFGKNPHGLNQPESLVLASLIRAPNANVKALEARVLHLNQRLQWPVPAPIALGKVQEIYPGIDHIKPRANLAPHLARQLLKNQPAGTHLQCTLSARLQRFAAEQLARQVDALADQNVSQGALLVLDNKTGDVLAYVSYSSQPSAGTFVDGIQAPRQTGSTLKPFLYATALDRRILTAASVLDDSPLDIAIPGGIYQPGNYDSTFRGPVSLRLALASSLNVPAVRTLMLVGPESFLNILRQLGIRHLEESGDYYGLSLALGSADMSLWELTNAYRALANGGVWRQARLTPDPGQPAGPRKKVFSPETAFIVSDILADRDARSDTFGLENPLATRFWTAVKTGTSKDMRDNWCIGYSSRYTVGVWVGNFSGASMWNVSGIAGAAPVWSAVMNDLHGHNAGFHPKAPKGLGRISLAGREDHPEWFLAGTEPDRHPAGIVRRNHRIIYPPSGTIIALDPDIPDHLQKVGFVAQTGKEDSLRWTLNEKLLADRGTTILWTPKAGKHVLAITNKQNVIVDSVQFEVR